MATSNQKIIAEALRIARTESFNKGFNFLCEKAPSTWLDIPGARFVWFKDKCKEHGIN